MLNQYEKENDKVEKKKRSVPITKEAKILRYLRLKAMISLVDASQRNNMTKAAICHMEKGRMRIPKERIRPIVLSYGYTMRDFEELMKMEEPPVCPEDECISIVRKLSNEKLQMAYLFLVQMKK